MIFFFSKTFLINHSNQFNILVQISSLLNKSKFLLNFAFSPKSFILAQKTSTVKLRIVFREDIQQLSQLFKVKKGSTVASAATSTLAL